MLLYVHCNCQSGYKQWRLRKPKMYLSKSVWEKDGQTEGLCLMLFSCAVLLCLEWYIWIVTCFVRLLLTDVIATDTWSRCYSQDCWEVGSSVQVCLYFALGLKTTCTYFVCLHNHLFWKFFFIYFLLPRVWQHVNPQWPGNWMNILLEYGASTCS